MAKLGFTIMSAIAMAVMATSCGSGEKELLTTIDPQAKSTAPAAVTRPIGVQTVKAEEFAELAGDILDPKPTILSPPRLERPASASGPGEMS